MTRVLLGKDTETGLWFETNDLADLLGFEEGAVVVVGEDGTLSELTGDRDGDVLVWNASTESWEASTVLTDLKDLMQEIALRLEAIRQGASPALYATELQALVEQVIAA